MVQEEELGSSKQAVTLSKVDEMEEHVAVEQELEEEEPPPPRELGRLDAELEKKLTWMKVENLTHFGVRLGLPE